MESPGSLTFEIQNISMIVDIAKKYNLITVIDNTWATSLYLKPMNYGVDISIQSATKYIVGHSDAMLGVITTNKKYAKQIRESAHNLGSCPGPEDIYLGIRGLKTLSIRLKKHQENAMKIIEWFLRQREVNRVLYPALPDNPGYKIWKKDFKGASGWKPREYLIWALNWLPEERMLRFKEIIGYTKDDEEVWIRRMRE